MDRRAVGPRFLYSEPESEKYRFIPRTGNTGAFCGRYERLLRDHNITARDLNLRDWKISFRKRRFTRAIFDVPVLEIGSFADREANLERFVLSASEKLPI